MNDRFKFRVWDQEKKEFLSFETFRINLEPEFNYNAETKELWIEFNHNRYVIQQSTGLKDKNGKLIYEGDIVKRFHVSSTMQGRVFNGFVAYDNERCRYCIFENKHCGYVTFSDTDDVFEVIGNIYENKELLNA